MTLQDNAVDETTVVSEEAVKPAAKPTAKPEVKTEVEQNTDDMNPAELRKWQYAQIKKEVYAAHDIDGDSTSVAMRKREAKESKIFQSNFKHARDEAGNLHTTGSLLSGASGDQQAALMKAIKEDVYSRLGITTEEGK